jgi:hypothetical protein
MYSSLKKCNNNIASDPLVINEVSHPNLDIHKLKEVVVLAHFAIVGMTYFSIISTSILDKCLFINCFWDGKTHL